MSAEAGQQHPLGIYYKIWILLFVLSSFSYAVDYFEVQGAMRWSLVILFMVLKAGFIVAIFMHVMWERMALVLTILGPPVVLLLLIGFMVIEGNYTSETRYEYRGHDRDAVALTPSDLHHEEEEAH
ncbi:MAG: cytochrome C oxidase subunit IV [Gammaproteobacteria bacterium]|jgi:caa(3)-type oxidase subunit IV|nr:cytochrome C oxidase subunit IV [Gammaproteobacteria bacterium]MBT3861100.1 cytochrome C oxidase subunit IV [Gammaproteobacteria bacterium]MBT3987690.1 cytochrome C oxidase subunit IV [Gammaproteobacteria bacterium]MBT4582730.1 cytochrome C oxidase subunit IV [Gammaproteobacteria bacterium]MBT4657942.1 cytochrome C oxidase subunit IV [Gammaproteobacteria bacterium]